MVAQGSCERRFFSATPPTKTSCAFHEPGRSCGTRRLALSAKRWTDASPGTCGYRTRTVQRMISGLQPARTHATSGRLATASACVCDGTCFHDFFVGGAIAGAFAAASKLASLAASERVERLSLFGAGCSVRPAQGFSSGLVRQAVVAAARVPLTPVTGVTGAAGASAAACRKRFILETKLPKAREEEV